MIYSSEDFKDKIIEDSYFLNEQRTNEQKNIDFYDINYERENSKEENAFRSLMENNVCDEYINKLRGLNKTLNDAFELKINQIHITSIIILIIICLSFICLIVYFCSFCGCICLCCFIKEPEQCLFCVPIFFILGIIVGFINLGSFIALIVFYYSGDITEYADFLDC